jgi:gamma-glutamylcyclotransferase
MLYFAYGSNMLIEQIRERAPSAASLGVASLRGYKLCWHKPGAMDHSGKCDVVSSPGSAVVYGVLYEIAEGDFDRLDKAETGYRRALANVEHAAKTVGAWVYFANTQDKSLRPYTWYKAIVVAGARRAHLPESYIAQLEAVAALRDHDRARHDGKMAMVHGTL